MDLSSIPGLRRSMRKLPKGKIPQSAASLNRFFCGTGSIIQGHVRDRFPGVDRSTRFLYNLRLRESKPERNEQQDIGRLMSPGRTAKEKKRIEACGGII